MDHHKESGDKTIKAMYTCHQNRGQKRDEEKKDPASAGWYIYVM